MDGSADVMVDVDGDLVRPIILYVEIGDARKAYGRR